MKRKWTKIAAAVLLALAVLDAFCAWYYNPPRYDWDESRATDNIRRPFSFASRATEGIAFSRMDANGYNNPAGLEDEDIFVLMMGSSHTEGLNVMQDETVPSRLGAYLAQAGMDGAVYNIGISAHTFQKNIANLDRALKRFAPKGYVIMETQNIKLHKRSIERAANDDFTRLAASPVVLAEWISDRPLLKTLYNQFSGLAAGTAGEAAEEEAEITADQLGQYQAALTELFDQLRRTAEAHGVVPIIYYHPHLILQEDGAARSSGDAGCLAAFAAACDAAGICFVDMTEPFLQAYAEERALPHGFVNSAPGAGHLNARGNEIIARVLSEEICRMEAAA